MGTIRRVSCPAVRACPSGGKDHPWTATIPTPKLGQSRSGCSHISRLGTGYVVAQTVLVTLLGSAGIYAFESHLPAGGPDSFGGPLDG